MKQDIEDEAKDLIERIKEKRNKRLEEFENFLIKTAELLECGACTIDCVKKFDSLDGKSVCLDICECYSIEKDD